MFISLFELRRELKESPDSPPTHIHNLSFTIQPYVIFDPELVVLLLARQNFMPYFGAQYMYVTFTQVTVDCVTNVIAENILLVMVIITS